MAGLMEAGANRMRNIVLSYMRDGLEEGEAVRAAADCVERLEKRKAILLQRRSRGPARRALAEQEKGR